MTSKGFQYYFSAFGNMIDSLAQFLFLKVMICLTHKDFAEGQSRLVNVFKFCRNDGQQLILQKYSALMA